jgi:hypothetical protein
MRWWWYLSFAWTDRGSNPRCTSLRENTLIITPPMQSTLKGDRNILSSVLLWEYGYNVPRSTFLHASKTTTKIHSILKSNTHDDIDTHSKTRIIHHNKMKNKMKYTIETFEYLNKSNICNVYCPHAYKTTKKMHSILIITFKSHQNLI